MGIPRGTLRRDLTILLAAVLLGAGLAAFHPTDSQTEPTAQPQPSEKRAPEVSAPVQPRASVTPHLQKERWGRPPCRPAGTPAPPPAFIETSDEHFEATGPHYRATLTAAAGLGYTPANSAARLQIRLRSVTRGEAIFDRTSDPDAAEELAISDGSGAVSYWRTPSLEERYVPRGDGVEQLFVLDQPPEGEGDLIVVCDLALDKLTPLPARENRGGGIFFADETGRVAVRYGQVVVRDSAQHGLVAEPVLSADARSVALTISGKWLDAASYPVVIDPLVGADFFITDAPRKVAQPTIAASSSQYLVVWNDYRAGLSQPQLIGRIVSGSGIVSAEFPLTASVLPPAVPMDYRFQRISAASDGTNWLVVWSDNRQIGAGVRFSIVQPGGTLLGGTDYGLALTTGAVYEDPLVVYNGTDYVVAWQDASSTGDQSRIYFTRVSTNGDLGAASSVPAALSPVNQALLFLAPQKPSGDTLLLFRENAEDPPVVRSVRIAADGSLRDPSGTALFKEDAADGGFGRPIGAAFVNSEWQILSSFDQNLDSSIFLHRLSTAGLVTAPTGVFAEMGISPGAVSNAYAPAFAGANEWLLLRNEKVSNTEYHIIGKRVTFSGQDMDPIPFQLDTAATGILRDPVAAPLSSSFLAVWLDGRQGGAQPGDARDIAGALIDATIAGTTDTALKAVALASPTEGDPPLTVNFDGSASQGTFDTLEWDFGDGGTATESVVSHTYRSNGTFNAVLKLTKGPYQVLDYVVIRVGQTSGTPEGGTKVGTPVANSDGMVTTLFINTLLIKLDFAKTGADTARATGTVDPAFFPTTLTGLAASVSISDKIYSFSLDAKGQSSSADTQFNVNPQTGAFTFGAVNTDLRAVMEALGAKNATVKPAELVNVPVTIKVDILSGKAVVGAAYRATQDDKGTANYVFLGDGKEVSGSFLLTKFTGNEDSAKGNLRGHTYAIKGRLAKPDGGTYKKAATGEWRITVGNYSVSLPVGQIQQPKKQTVALPSLWDVFNPLDPVNPWDLLPKGEKKKSNVLKFVGRSGTSGLKKFTLNASSGVFTLQLAKVPAGGAGGSGMPLAKESSITKVDLNLSFEFDLDSGKLSAGRYMYIGRKDTKSKSWTLR